METAAVFIPFEVCAAANVLANSGKAENDTEDYDDLSPIDVPRTQKEITVALKVSRRTV